MNFYPYTSPIILTDDIFTLYGGHTGTSIAAQRSAAYFIAERIASDDIDSFLLPTIVTGSYLFNPYHKIILEYAFVNRVIQTQFLQRDEEVYFTVTGTDNLYVTLANDEYGLVLVDPFRMSDQFPYKLRFVYEAGIPSGTSFRPDILLGLSTYADIILNEIQGYGNEAPGDIGVQSFRNQQYSEDRVGLIRTAFGTSARAQFVHQMFTRLRNYRWVGM